MTDAQKVDFQNELSDSEFTSEIDSIVNSPAHDGLDADAVGAAEDDMVDFLDDFFEGEGGNLLMGDGDDLVASALSESITPRQQPPAEVGLRVVPCADEGSSGGAKRQRVTTDGKWGESASATSASTANGRDGSVSPSSSSCSAPASPKSEPEPGKHPPLSVPAEQQASPAGLTLDTALPPCAAAPLPLPLPPPGRMASGGSVDADAGPAGAVLHALDPARSIWDGAGRGANVTFRTATLPVYWRNARNNLQCFPHCAEFGSYEAFRDSGKKHAAKGQCKGAVFVEVALSEDLRRRCGGVGGGVQVLARFCDAFQALYSMPQRQRSNPAVLTPSAFASFRKSCFDAEATAITPQGGCIEVGVDGQQPSRSIWQILPKVCWQFEAALSKRKRKRPAAGEAGSGSDGALTADDMRARCVDRFCLQVVVFAPLVSATTGEPQMECVGMAATHPFELASTRTMSRKQKKVAAAAPPAALVAPMPTMAPLAPAVAPPAVTSTPELLTPPVLFEGAAAGVYDDSVDGGAWRGGIAPVTAQGAAAAFALDDLDVLAPKPESKHRVYDLQVASAAQPTAGVATSSGKAAGSHGEIAAKRTAQSGGEEQTQEGAEQAQEQEDDEEEDEEAGEEEEEGEVISIQTPAQAEHDAKVLASLGTVSKAVSSTSSGINPTPAPPTRTPSAQLDAKLAAEFDGSCHIVHCDEKAKPLCPESVDTQLAQQAPSRGGCIGVWLQGVWRKVSACVGRRSTAGKAQGVPIALVAD